MTDWVTVERYALKDALLGATDADDRVEAEQNDPVSTRAKDAASEMPKLCLYLKEDTHESGGTGTSWSTTTTILIDCWAYGVEQEAPALSAREVAADARDELVSQVLGATSGSREWLSRFDKVTRVRVARNVFAQGDLVIGVAQIQITCALVTDHGLDANAALAPFERAVTTIENALDPTGAPLQIDVALEQDE